MGDADLPEAPWERPPEGEGTVAPGAEDGRLLMSSPRRSSATAAEDGEDAEDGSRFPSNSEGDLRENSCPSCDADLSATPHLLLCQACYPAGAEDYDAAR
jgi:hypothetical protein